MKRQFVEQGCLRLPGLVAPELVEGALRVINHQLGQGSKAWASDAPLRLGGDVGSSDEVRSLVCDSPTLGVLEQLLGDGLSLASRPQCALRFPNLVGPNAAKSEEQWHIDGMGEDCHMSPFDLLVGVALSDQPCDDCGNLAVWPGTHVKLHEAVGKYRADLEQRNDADWRTLWQQSHCPLLKDDNVRQVHMHPGDVVIAHQKLPHRISFNRSPNVRYQVYFRVQSAVLPDRDGRLDGLWERFQGLHGLVQTDVQTDAPTN